MKRVEHRAEETLARAEEILERIAHAPIESRARLAASRAHAARIQQLIDRMKEI